MKCRFVLLGMLVLLTGCELLGPSIGDVKAALEAVGRGIEISTSDHLKPEFHSMYANTADATFTTEDKSIIHNMCFLIDNDINTTIFIGDCNFSGYSDSVSGYKINGVFSYDMNILNEGNNEDDDDMYGEMKCRLSMTGGKLSSLDLSISRTKAGEFNYSVMANGKKIDLDKGDKSLQIMHTISPAMSAKM